MLSGINPMLKKAFPWRAIIARGFKGIRVFPALFMHLGDTWHLVRCCLEGVVGNLT